MGIQGFEFHDVLENKTYEIGVDDLKIPVTTKEVLDFYPAEHRLKETDIEQYAAAYTARIKEEPLRLRRCNRKPCKRTSS